MGFSNSLLAHRPLKAMGVIMLSVALAGCATTERVTRGFIATAPFVESADVYELGEALSKHMSIAKPDGEGPFPTIIQFHGCGGLVAPDGDRQPILDEYAQSAVNVGVAAITVDSFAHRGISREEALERVCPGRKLRGVERAADVLAAVEYVRRLDFVDNERIAVAGWSHGGWAVMDLLSMDLERRWPAGLRNVPPQKLDGVVAAHLTYPYASFPSRTKETGWAWPVNARFVVVVGDTIAPTDDTRESIARVYESGAQVEAVEFEGLTHGFDERYHSPGSSLVYDDDAAKAARAAYADWLERVLVDQSASGAIVFASGQMTGKEFGAMAKAADAPVQMRVYTVKRGDSLSKIAKSEFGDPWLYRLIYDANRDVVRDPDLIQPGQSLSIPSVP